MTRRNISIAAATSPHKEADAGWIRCEDRQPAIYGRYKVRRRLRGRKIEEDTYLWNGGYWVTNGGSISRAVVEWFEEDRK